MEAGRLGVPEAEPFGVSWCGHKLFTHKTHKTVAKPSHVCWNGVCGVTRARGPGDTFPASLSGKQQHANEILVRHLTAVKVGESECMSIREARGVCALARTQCRHVQEGRPRWIARSRQEPQTAHDDPVFRSISERQGGEGGAAGRGRQP